MNILKNRKIEIRVKNDTPELEVEKEPFITKDELIEISKKSVKYVVGGILIVLASAAAIDTAKFGAMSAIDNHYNNEDSED